MKENETKPRSDVNAKRGYTLTQLPARFVLHWEKITKYHWVILFESSLFILTFPMQHYMSLVVRLRQRGHCKHFRHTMRILIWLSRLVKRDGAKYLTPFARVYVNVGLFIGLFLPKSTQISVTDCPELTFLLMLAYLAGASKNSVGDMACWVTSGIYVYTRKNIFFWHWRMRSDHSDLKLALNHRHQSQFDPVWPWRVLQENSRLGACAVTAATWKGLPVTRRLRHRTSTLWEPGCRGMNVSSMQTPPSAALSLSTSASFIGTFSTFTRRQYRNMFIKTRLVVQAKSTNKNYNYRRKI